VEAKRGYKSMARSCSPEKCEIGASQRGQELLNAGTGKSTALGAVTKQRLVKTQQAQKTVHDVVNCRVCELAIAL
jgi:hypothetical protein